MPCGRFFTKEGVRGYRFGFNGKEKVDEVYGDANAYDFGARLYDPRLGRWLAVDPLAGKFSHLSPYNYTSNNPIYYVDVDGRDIWIGFEATQGKSAGHTTIMYTTYEKVQVTVNGVEKTLYRKTGMAITEHNQYNINSDDKKASDYQNWESSSLQETGMLQRLGNSQDTRVKIKTATGIQVEGETYFTPEEIKEELMIYEYANKKEKENKGKETFDLSLNNCTDYAVEILGKMGIKTNGKEKIFVFHKSGKSGHVSNPNSLFKWVKAQINQGIQPNWKIEKQSDEINQDPTPTIENYGGQ